MISNICCSQLQSKTIRDFDHHCTRHTGNYEVLDLKFQKILNHKDSIFIVDDSHQSKTAPTRSHIINFFAVKLISI